MSAGFDDRDRDAGEVFMLTFAAIGGLELLAAEPASASLSIPLPPPSPEEAQQLLSGAAPPSPGVAALSVVAGAGEAAFLSAALAFTPGLPAPSVVAETSAATDLGAPELAGFAYWGVAPDGEDVVGSSSLGGLAVETAAFSVRGDDLVVALAAGATLTIGGHDDLVLTSPQDTIHVLSNSSVAVRGGGASVTLASDDRLTLSGAGYDVRAEGADDVVTVEAASRATVFGDGVVTQLAAPSAEVTIGGGAPTHINQVYMQSGGAVNLMDASALAAHGAGAAYLGANDFLALFGAFDVYASAAGASVISAFGDGDTLHVHTAYSDIAALLGAATQAQEGTVLHLSRDDSLTLAGLGKAQVSDLAMSAHIALY